MFVVYHQFLFSSGSSLSFWGWMLCMIFALNNDCPLATMNIKSKLSAYVWYVVLLYTVYVLFRIPTKMFIQNGGKWTVNAGRNENILKIKRGSGAENVKRQELRERTSRTLCLRIVATAKPFTHLLKFITYSLCVYVEVDALFLILNFWTFCSGKREKDGETRQSHRCSVAANKCAVNEIMFRFE